MWATVFKSNASVTQCSIPLWSKTLALWYGWNIVALKPFICRRETWRDQRRERLIDFDTLMFIDVHWCCKKCPIWKASNINKGLECFVSPTRCSLLHATNVMETLKRTKIFTNMSPLTFWRIWKVCEASAEEENYTVNVSILKPMRL